MTARIKDVAALAGVSTATVSHVLNGTRYVSDEAKVKVLDAMKRLSYTPNTVARSLRSRKSRTVGLIIPVPNHDNSDHFFMTMANGVESVLRQHNYQLMLSNSREDYQEELNCIRMFNNQWIDGLILAPTPRPTGTPLHPVFGEYPVVYVDRKPGKADGDCVLVNALEGSADAVQTLIRKGHSRIGLITSAQTVSSVEERVTGYRLALERGGLPYRQSYIREGDSTAAEGYRLARELLMELRVTALFIANNSMGIGAMRYLKEQRIRVPEEVALICFDDYDWTGITDPPLTVVRQPAFQLGETAAETLLSRIRNPAAVYTEYRLPAELVARASV